MSVTDNHNKWGKVDWSSDGDANEGMVRPLASRDASGKPYRPEIKYSYAVPNDTREGRISKAALDSLPEGRREEVESLIFRKADYDNYSSTAPIYSGKNSLIKTAMAQGLGGQLHISGTGNSTHLMPNLYSPLFLTANLQLPRDRITANAWNRAFYQTNPIVRNAINLHATYPISKLNVKCKDKAIERKYLEMAQRVDLFSVVQKISLEYWMLGEVFPYAAYDHEKNMWSRVYCHNPDYVVVRKNPATGENTIALRPDPKLQHIVQSTDPAHKKYRDQLDPALLDAVAKNQYIPLDNFNISHIKNESHDYDAHGTSIIVSVWKDLVLWDLFRENKFIQADAMVNPLTLVKVGVSSPEGHYPRQEELQAYRDVFEQAQYDKDFKIFTHNDVAVERIGYNSGILDITSDMNFLLDNIFIGLMVPKAIVLQEGAAYQNASVGLDVIKQRYENFRGKISNWLINKIFAPMAEANGFYETIDGEKRLVLPSIEWNQMTLYDVDTYIQHLTGLMDKAPPQAPTGVSRQTVYRSLGLDFQDELSNQRREAIQLAILEKEMAEIKKMPLGKLRSLDMDAPIQESTEESSPLPGQQPPEAGAAMPAAPDLGVPDMGMPAPPGGGLLS